MRAALRWVHQENHRIWGIFWILAVIPTVLWWSQSILWVLLMSLWANIETAFGAHHAKVSTTTNDERRCDCEHRADCEKTKESVQ